MSRPQFVIPDAYARPPVRLAAAQLCASDDPVQLLLSCLQPSAGDEAGPVLLVDLPPVSPPGSADPSLPSLRGLAAACRKAGLDLVGLKTGPDGRRLVEVRTPRCRLALPADGATAVVAGLAAEHRAEKGLLPGDRAVPSGDGPADRPPPRDPHLLRVPSRRPGRPRGE